MAIFILEEPKINSNEIGIFVATHYTIFMTPFCLIRCRLATPAQILLLCSTTTYFGKGACI